MNKVQKKSQRSQLSLEKKMELIRRSEIGAKRCELAKEFSIAQSSVHYILARKENIVRKAASLQEQNGTLQRTKISGVEDSTVEKTLYEWFKQKRAKAEPVSGPLLKEKALQFNEELGNNPTFKASNGWLANFKKRHQIRLSVQDEKFSADEPPSVSFCEQLNSFVTEHAYDLDNVYNAYETGLAWKTLPRKILPLSQEWGASGIKDLVTIMICANATGTHRIPLMVIGKAKKHHCFKNIVQLPLEYRSQKNALMDSLVMDDWYLNVFLPSVRSRNKDDDKKCLLLLNNAPSHQPAEHFNALDNTCHVMYLPSNVTSLTPPLDQGIIEALKRLYKKSFLRELLAEVNVHENTVKTFIKKWTLLDCIKSLATEWDNLAESTLRNGWNKLFPILEVINAEPETDNEELLQLVTQIHGSDGLFAEDVRDWLRIDQNFATWHKLAEEELVHNHLELMNEPLAEGLREDVNIKEEEEEEDNDEPPTPEELLKAHKMLQKWRDTRGDWSEDDQQCFRKEKDVLISEILSFKNS